MAFSTNFICRSSKADKKGQSPIELSININGIRTYISLPMKMNAGTYTKLINEKRNNYLKDFIETQRTKVNIAIAEISKTGELTTAALKDYFVNGAKVYTIKDLFDDYFRLINEDEKNRLVLRDFAKLVNMSSAPSTVTNATILEFFNYCKANYKESTAYHKMNRLKSVIKFAIDNNRISTNPFCGIRLTKPKANEEYLTEAEICALKGKELHCERLDKVRDLLLFQLSSGMSYADMLNLKKEDLQEENGIYYVEKKRVKTNITFYSVFLPNAIEIWNKYQGTLPMLTNQKYNAYLKEIGDLCGIEKNLHTHLFRKTYGTILLNSGVPMETVSKCLGHSNLLITQSTYAFLRKSTIIANVGEKINKAGN